MRKLYLVISTLFAISGLIFTSCQKDKVGSTSFTATLEECQDDNGKTAFYNGTMRWVSGDRIKVFGTTGNGVYVASVHGGGDAVFTVESGDAGEAPYRAVYPATAANDDGTVELPVVQKTVDGSLTGFPMYAQGRSTNLDFKNLCGVLRMRLQKSDVSIIAIEVTGDIMVTGDYNVSYNNNGIPTLEYYSHGTKTTMMTCATPQSIENPKDFYIFLPVHTYGEGMRIRIYSSDGRVCTKTVTANHNVNIQRSKITTITLLNDNLTFVPDAGVLPGFFTIDAAGHQVRFSQGNLQYTTLGVWRFAPDQYKRIASDNQFISDVYPKWIDLFGWGTGNNPTFASSDYSDYSDFVDWGSNAIINGGNVTNRWRTLTKDEWTYLFFTRSNTALGTTNARYVKAKVNDVQGIILFPNGYNHPTDLSIPQYINNTSGSGWDANNYTLAQWSEMEAAGAVFFPVTGYRAGTECRNPTLYGMYWSSTPETPRYSLSMSFASHFVQTGNSYNCSYGFGVRLVLDNN